MTNAPHATLVFDHFHVVKLLNDTIDEIRRDTYKMEMDLNKRKVLKGTRWLLLRNERDIFDDKYKTRLDNALAMNEDLKEINKRMTANKSFLSNLLIHWPVIEQGY